MKWTVKKIVPRQSPKFSLPFLFLRFSFCMSLCSIYCSWECSEEWREKKLEIWNSKCICTALRCERQCKICISRVATKIYFNRLSEEERKLFSNRATRPVCLHTHTQGRNIISNGKSFVLWDGIFGGNLGNYMLGL